MGGKTTFFSGFVDILNELEAKTLIFNQTTQSYLVKNKRLMMETIEYYVLMGEIQDVFCNSGQLSVKSG